MRYRIIPVTPFQQNCSLIWCEVTGRAAFIDPGGEAERLLAAAKEEGVTVERIFLTHGHLDHVGAAAELARRLSAPIEGPQRDEAFWLDALPKQSAMFGFPPADGFVPDRWLTQGDCVAVGHVTLEVLHCPGHTPGHVVFFHRESGTVFAGDVLFKGSIGRTDFPRGDHGALLNAIRTRIFPLGDDVVVVPGHGPKTTIGEERRSNPYVGEQGSG